MKYLIQMQDAQLHILVYSVGTKATRRNVAVRFA